MSDLLERVRNALADRYAVDDEVGRGGMGAVFRALDRKHRRTVAIKVLDPEVGASIGGGRFLREIEVAAQLQHPHILSLYDSGESDGLLYYVMPFVEGESLRNRLDREQQLPLDEAIQLTREVGGALAYAHSRGVVHRDIKPENIMLTGGHAVVMDFGIARALSVAGSESLTQTGTAIGTPYYMSPEQAMGLSVDGRSDEYSLACTLYEMLIGQPPFTGPTPQAVLARHSLEAVPSLQIVRNTIPDDVEDAILRAMNKIPADRFQTVSQFADALGAARGTVTGRHTAQPVQNYERQSRTPVEMRAMVPFWRRRRVLIGAGAGVVLSAVVVGTLIRAGGAGAAAPSGPAPSRIAVLYFGDRSPGGELAYLADGLTEALIDELSRVEALTVISRNGVAPYRDGRTPLDSVARALDVGTVVSGTVQASDTRLRVSVALVDASTGEQLDSRTIERPRSDIIALQDSLSEEVSGFLRARLGEEVQLRETRAGTTNADAWELLQRAQRLRRDVDTLVNAGDTATAARLYRRADSLLAAAETRDRAWSTPATQRGWLAYDQAGLAGVFDKEHYEDWLRRGLEHADQALRRNARDADALELRGTWQYVEWLLNIAPAGAQAESLFAAAERDLRAATDVNPTQASAWTTLTHLLFNKGAATGEAKMAALKAWEGDPYLTTAGVTLWRLFAASLDLEDRTDAARWCEIGQRRFSGDPRFVECQLWLFALKQTPPDRARPWALLKQYVEMSPPTLHEFRRLRGELFVAMALVRADLPDSARAVASRVRRQVNAENDPTRETAYLEAIVRTMLGDYDEAVRLLSTFLAVNPQQRASLAQDDTWWFSDLRARPEFRRLVGSSR
jgi:serine/threonine-protein kinase